MHAILFKLVFAALMLASATVAQENAQLQIPQSLEECYRDDFFMNRDNRLPMTLSVLISLIEKIEDAPGYNNQDIRQIAVSLLHRFRQDGIERAPGVRSGDGILPYSPIGFQFSKFRILLTRLIPGNAFNFPNSTLSDQERCTLHFMLSSSFDARVRGDEGQRCNQLAQFRAERVTRSVGSKAAEGNFIGDIEILDSLKTRKKGRIQSNDGENETVEYDDEDNEQRYYDVNMFDVGPNLVSQCPLENGAILTPHGTVSAGNLIAGIAAGLQPQRVQLRQLLALASRRTGSRVTQQNQMIVDNVWASTLAGDLAEVALIQVPSSQSSVDVGANGAWNNTYKPQHYFLTKRVKLEMTDAEIRGGLDGLIMGRKIAGWRDRNPTLKLSQLLRMYYSQKGVLDSGVRGCDRKNLFTDVAPIDDLKAQTSAFAHVLDREMQLRVTLRSEAIFSFSDMAAEALSSYIPRSLNDISCEVQYPTYPNVIPAEAVTAFTDIFVYIDTVWRYSDIGDFLLYIFNKINISPRGSTITLLNANDCKEIVQTTSSIGDVYSKWNETTQQLYPNGFNLPKIIGSLQAYSTNLLKEEKQNSSLGGRSLIALLVPQQSNVGDGDATFAEERLQILRQESPDLKFLYFGGGSIQRFSRFVDSESQDLFTLRIGENVPNTCEPVVKRIKEIPRRIINHRCGENWQTNDWGISQQNQFIRPGSLNFYRLHPNYFFHPGNNRHVRIQGQGPVTLTICSSRSTELPTVNQTNKEDLNCRQIISDTFDVDLSEGCKGYWLIHRCPPLYISVEATSQVGGAVINCNDLDCEYPDQIRYVLQTENLGCYSGVQRLFASVFVIVASVVVSRFV